MVESEAYFIKQIEIPCEMDNINFEAREIGFYSNLFEKEEDIEQKQYYLLFIEYAEGRLTDATKRLTEYREKLNDFDKQQRLIPEL
jgi:hypothetical protein